ncbi:chitinase [Priestia megaterium]|uniref:chitinase n=1 Tax=Priestia megaterium TaxID=1404 RepID=UPI002676E681|nr:chitinase [Priestia megaterium]WKU22092.1 chitinase [Priestia megaterium]
MEHKPLLMGYWHDRFYYRPFSSGSPAYVNLLDIPEEYNVIAVSHGISKQQSFDEYVPFRMTEEEYYEQVTQLNLKGRQLLFNLGKPDESWCGAPPERIGDRIFFLIHGKGFRGICIDLESEIIDSNGNRLDIPAILKYVKDCYTSRNVNFSIHLAYHYGDLLNGKDGQSPPYLAELEGYYDLVSAKLYYEDILDNVAWFNDFEDLMGITGDEPTEDFLYYLMDSLANGTRGFAKIPHDKLVLGLPANQGATHKGHVSDPSAVLNAMERLKQSGTPIRGLSAYSINWDAGKKKDGQPYSYEFIKRYKDILKPT